MGKFKPRLRVGRDPKKPALAAAELGVMLVCFTDRSQMQLLGQDTLKSHDLTMKIWGKIGTLTQFKRGELPSSVFQSKNAGGRLPEDSYA